MASTSTLRWELERPPRAARPWAPPLRPSPCFSSLTSCFEPRFNLCCDAGRSWGFCSRSPPNSGCSQTCAVTSTALTRSGLALNFLAGLVPRRDLSALDSSLFNRVQKSSFSVCWSSFAGLSEPSRPSSPCRTCSESSPLPGLSLPNPQTGLAPTSPARKRFSLGPARTSAFPGPELAICRRSLCSPAHCRSLPASSPLWGLGSGSRLPSSSRHCRPRPLALASASVGG